MKGQTLISALAGALLLSGCVATVQGGHTYASPYGAPVIVAPPPPAYGGGPSLSDLNHPQRQALKQGCAEHYGFGTRRYDQCVSGMRHSTDALVSGCSERYAGDPRRMRRCMGL